MPINDGDVCDGACDAISLLTDSYLFSRKDEAADKTRTNHENKKGLPAIYSAYGHKNAALYKL